MPLRARVLVIGGLDPSGGAGITADARTLLAHDCDALPVVAAITVQNRRGMQRIEPVEGTFVHDQIKAAIDDGGVCAIKTGLLGSAAMVERIAELLGSICPDIPLVVDPVLSATAGGYDAGHDVAVAYRTALSPRAFLLTPNLAELEAIALQGGAASLLERGCEHVLVKGGHGVGESLVDELWSAAGRRAFSHARLHVGPVHGTGCALATALAAGLARGLTVDVACERAIAWLQCCLRAMPLVVGDGLPRPLPIVFA